MSTRAAAGILGMHGIATLVSTWRGRTLEERGKSSGRGKSHSGGERITFK